MIEIGIPELMSGIKNTWRKCFTFVDPRYTEFFFRNIFLPEYGYAQVEDNKVTASLCRIPHVMMFQGRAIKTSMISGVAQLPEYRKYNYAEQLLYTALDACEHTELITLIHGNEQVAYEEYGFKPIYKRRKYKINRDQIKRITNIGCAYDPQPLDMLKVYSAYIRRFNGFLARDAEYYVNLKKEITARGGKILAYYNSDKQIQGYATILIAGKEAIVEECVYLNSMALTKLINGALQERAQIQLHVSEAEQLERIYEGIESEVYPAVFARINDTRLFSRLFRKNVETVEEAFGISEKPLNLNEHM